MARLSELALAERTGSSEENVRRLVELGVLTPAGSEEPFELGDVQRIRLAEALERSGMSLEDVGKAIRSGELSLSALDALFPAPAVVSGTTYAELASGLGVEMEAVERLHTGLGLPRPLPHDRIREDDAEVLSTALSALAPWLDTASLTRVTRFFGENLRRVAESGVRFFHTSIEEPMLRAGLPERQMIEMGAQIGSQLRPVVDRMVQWLHDRHLEHYIMEHVIEHIENAMEQAGRLYLDRSEHPRAIVFLDLSGYTRLTEERGDEAAAELAATFGELVQEGALRYRGRPIKWLGDGVMFHFPDAGHAVQCSLEMVEQAPRSGLPPAHVGVNAGPVVFRDGDYFGRTVNIASRLAGHAGPEQVLVTDEVVRTSAADEVTFEPIGPIALKGVESPVSVHRAARRTR
jgi:adenylate cyclase